MKNVLTRVLGPIVATIMVAMPAQAQDFPTKPVTLIVPYGAGGPTDIAARLLADGLGEALGQSVIVENKAGGSTVIGADYVAKSKPDGYTILMSAATTFIANPHLNKNLSYQVDDFEPVAMVSKVPLVLVASNKVPATTVGDFIEWAKENEGSANYGTSGAGSSAHLMMAMFLQQVDTKMTHIPYQGSAAASVDLIAGNIDTMIDGIASAHTMTKAGTAHALGLFSNERWSEMPELKTFEEQGFPEATAYSWFAIVAPEGTPADVLDKLHAGVNAALEKAEMQKKFIEGGQTVFITSRDEAQTFIDEEYKRWGDVISTSNITLE